MPIYDTLPSFLVRRALATAVTQREIAHNQLRTAQFEREAAHQRGVSDYVAHERSGPMQRAFRFPHAAVDPDGRDVGAVMGDQMAAQRMLYAVRQHTAPNPNLSFSDSAGDMNDPALDAALAKTGELNILAGAQLEFEQMQKEAVFSQLAANAGSRLAAGAKQLTGGVARAGQAVAGGVRQVAGQVAGAARGAASSARDAFGAYSMRSTAKLPTTVAKGVKLPANMSERPLSRPSIRLTTPKPVPPTPSQTTMAGGAGGIKAPAVNKTPGVSASTMPIGGSPAGSPAVPPAPKVAPPPSAPVAGPPVNAAPAAAPAQTKLPDPTAKPSLLSRSGTWANRGLTAGTALGVAGLGATAYLGGKAIDKGTQLMQEPIHSAPHWSPGGLQPPSDVNGFGTGVY